VAKTLPVGSTCFLFGPSVTSLILHILPLQDNVFHSGRPSQIQFLNRHSAAPSLKFVIRSLYTFITSDEEIESRS
jgi:hypothetical protein